MPPKAVPVPSSPPGPFLPDVPDPEDVRARLIRAMHEAKVLRKLLKVAEQAKKVRQQQVERQANHAA